MFSTIRERHAINKHKCVSTRVDMQLYLSIRSCNVCVHYDRQAEAFDLLLACTFVTHTLSRITVLILYFLRSQEITAIGITTKSKTISRAKGKYITILHTSNVVMYATHHIPLLNGQLNINNCSTWPTTKRFSFFVCVRLTCWVQVHYSVAQASRIRSALTSPFAPKAWTAECRAASPNRWTMKLLNNTIVHVCVMFVCWVLRSYVHLVMQTYLFCMRASCLYSICMHVALEKSFSVTNHVLRRFFWCVRQSCVRILAHACKSYILIYFISML